MDNLIHDSSTTPNEPDVVAQPPKGLSPAELRSRLWQLALLFARLGATGFGGPAVLIAMMEDEVVHRRQWLSRQHFLDLVGATNLIPGPNAVEMSIHVGYLHAGWTGLFVAGFTFITPAVLVTSLLAWIYVTYGKLPEVAPFLFGIKPAILAVILTALNRLLRPALKNWQLGAIGATVLLATLLGLNEVLAMLGGGLLGMAWLGVRARFRARAGGSGGMAGMALVGWWALAGRQALHVPLERLAALFARAGTLVAQTTYTLASAAAVVPVTLWRLFLFFLRTGAVLYGSGYVLVAFIQGGLVRDLGWLTDQQLLDAIAAGQITPGPFVSTAAFVGFMLLGLPGAFVASAGVFTPSFLFAFILNPLVPRLRRSPWTAAFLDAINISAVGLMAAVLVQLGIASLTTWPTWVIAALAAVVALRWKVSPTWIVLGGAVLGWAFHLLGF